MPPTEQTTIPCPQCHHYGETGMLPVPLVVHDPPNERVIFFIPDDPQTTSQMLGQLFNGA